uniref:Uncharacterized protein AlNc14C178G8173 n=1 Tax=Albugo laibachii Nc14 TaxID=890382 RepID=F0WP20_9STRA|nr:conserved hypothetical protein [Albugo laibachii Nc14]|eukprot:CCA23064.1 conserved hypothetical protein [Albugo laibachii Nc14]
MESSTVVESAALLDDPRLCFSASDEFQSCRENNFTKGVQTSPDNLCLLTNSEDHTIRIFEPSLDQDCANAQSVLQIKEPGSIYDMTWYPHMNSSYPSTCCFLTTSKDQPIHLWDAYSGQLRASFRAFDHLDELTSAMSIAFNSTADKIYAGFERMIRVFDISRPSRNFESRPLAKTKKAKQGQRGLISSIHFNPDHSKMYAAGSYHGTTGLYTEDSGEELMTLCTHDGRGITQVRFSHDGNLLFTAARRDGRIHCWDLRRTNDILYTFHRKADTNQRIAFDLHCGGRYLVTGSQDGNALLFDIQKGIQVSDKMRVSDAINGVSFFQDVSPLRIALSSGQRHYKLAPDMEEPIDNVDESAPENNVVQIYKYELESISL